MTTSILPPIHPGEMLREEYLAPLKMSAGVLAKRLNLSRSRIERIVAETHPITTDTALRLAKLFKTSPEFWMNMQTSYDLKIDGAAKREEIAAIQELVAA
jgi:antitoxin HigA-1